jgi:hypothetical protein
VFEQPRSGTTAGLSLSLVSSRSRKPHCLPDEEGCIPKRIVLIVSSTICTKRQRAETGFIPACERFPTRNYPKCSGHITVIVLPCCHLLLWQQSTRQGSRRTISGGSGWPPHIESFGQDNARPATVKPTHADFKLERRPLHPFHPKMPPSRPSARRQ